MFLSIYTQPLYRTVLGLILILLLWSIGISLFQRQQRKVQVAWRVGCGVLFFCWLGIVLYETVFGRTPTEDAYMNVLPFSHLVTVLRGGNEELFRTDWMNLLLFVPCGMFLSQMFGQWAHSLKGVLFIGLIGFAISALVEGLQFGLSVGNLECDDCIFNTLGTFVGCIPAYILGGRARCLLSKSLCS